ncbi:hypothetical protein ACFQYP_20420 [Nonomuraea antimicrobica]
MTTDSAGRLQTARGCPFSPPEQHLRLLREQPVAKVTLPMGTNAWVAARHEDIRTILSDPRFTANRRHPNSPRLFDRPESPETKSALPKMMLEMDPPEHGPVRRAVVGSSRCGASRPCVRASSRSWTSTSTPCSTARARPTWYATSPSRCRHW